MARSAAACAAAATLIFAASPAFAQGGGTPIYPGWDHDNLGECYGYVVAQYLDGFDEEGLEFGLDNCGEIYAAEIAVMRPTAYQQLRQTALDEARSRKR